MRQIRVGTPGGDEALSIFRKLLHDGWVTGSLSGPLARIKVDEKNCFGIDGMAGSARGGVAVSTQAHGSSSVETSKPVSC